MQNFLALLGYMGHILDNGKENGSYYLGFRGYGCKVLGLRVMDWEIGFRFKVPPAH